MFDPAIETLLVWPALVFLCGTTIPADDLALWEVMIGWTAAEQFGIATTPADVLEYLIPFAPAPGEVLYMRIRAWDYAGNNSDQCVH